jgi:hypothetical protein
LGESADWRAVREICWRSPANRELVIVDGRKGAAGVVPLFEFLLWSGRVK